MQEIKKKWLTITTDVMDGLLLASTGRPSSEENCKVHRDLPGIPMNSIALEKRGALGWISL